MSLDNVEPTGNTASAKPEPVTVALLTKAPIPGTVKTRLVMMLGVEGATRLHERLTERAVMTANAADVGPVVVWGSPDERHPFFTRLVEEHGVTVERQPKGDLGERTLAVFKRAQRPTIVIGADCPALKPEHLRETADLLRSGTEAVVFPAEDGGYVLIGLRQLHPSLFDDMPWGSERVMIETRRRLAQLNLSWRERATLWDVDRPSDIRRLRRDGFEELVAGLTRDAKPLEFQG
jgi:rSAM/selenodomain-associated transferase 1